MIDLNPRLLLIIQALWAAKLAGTSFSEAEVTFYQLGESSLHTLMRKIVTVVIVLKLTITAHCFPQAGSADLSQFACVLVPIDFEAIKVRRQVQRLTGTHVRNQVYYDLAIASGVHGAGNNVTAPAYIIAAVEAAVPWGKGGIPGLIPVVDCDKLESSPAILEVDLFAALGFIKEMRV